MTYEEARDAIHAKLIDVSGVGAVFKSPKYTADWDSFLNRFATPDPLDPTKRRINVLWFTRSVGTDNARRDESGVVVLTDNVDTWTITLIYGFEDDDAAPSEYTFQELCDAVQDALRPMGVCSFNAIIVPQSEPLARASSGLAMFGGVLCHLAVFQLRISSQFTS